MLDALIEYIKAHDGVSSLNLAEEILKFKNCDEKNAHKTISAILSKENRCYFGPDNLWHYSFIKQKIEAKKSLRNIPFVAVYLLVHPQNPTLIYHCSVWTVEDAPRLLFEAWFRDPSELSYEEQETLRSIIDTPFNQEPIESKIYRLIKVCKNKKPVFLSYNQYSILENLLAQYGFYFGDDYFLISTMMACAKLPAVRPLILEKCWQIIFNSILEITYAYKQGESFALCINELIRILLEQGKNSIDDLEKQEESQLSNFDFTNKKFSIHDLKNLPNSPGVYGFKDDSGKFIYIGKSSNLKRRITRYFGNTYESPEKISKIRKNIYEITFYQCGSELESLIYEYRLIKKYTPFLNTQESIKERKGIFKPVEDCIVLLPHAEKNKGMSLWFRKNQKIILKPFLSDFSDIDVLETEIDNFFFSNKLPVSKEDFPLQEIATRWIKKYQNELAIVWINNYISSKEVCKAIKSLWKDVQNIVYLK
jgi:hypothetical protein